MLSEAQTGEFIEDVKRAAARQGLHGQITLIRPNGSFAVSWVGAPGEDDVDIEIRITSAGRAALKGEPQ